MGELQMEKLDTASIVASVLTTLTLAPTLSLAAPPAPVPTYAFEKCYGVNAAAHNDCAASGHHSCAGEATRANDPQSWIYLPAGSCAKIQGGNLAPKS
jgi:uncharacterized membrane protein